MPVSTGMDLRAAGVDGKQKKKQKKTSRVGGTLKSKVGALIWGLLKSKVGALIWGLLLELLLVGMMLIACMLRLKASGKMIWHLVGDEVNSLCGEIES